MRRHPAVLWQDKWSKRWLLHRKARSLSGAWDNRWEKADGDVAEKPRRHRSAPGLFLRTLGVRRSRDRAFKTGARAVWSLTGKGPACPCVPWASSWGCSSQHLQSGKGGGAKALPQIVSTVYVSCTCIYSEVSLLLSDVCVCVHIYVIFNLHIPFSFCQNFTQDAKRFFWILHFLKN